MDSPRTTSHSQLNAAMQCPWLYYVSTRFRSKMKITTEPKLVGIMVHEIIESFLLTCDFTYSRSRKSQMEFMDKELKEKFEQYFNKDMLDGVYQYKDEYQDAIEHTKSLFTARTGRPSKAPTMCFEWKKNYQDKFQQLEQELFLPLLQDFQHIRLRNTPLHIYNHIERCLRGFIDIHRNMERPDKELVEYQIRPRVNIQGLDKGGRIDYVVFYGDEYFIYDFKSGRKNWTVEAVANEPQLLWYAYALRELFGYPASGIGIMDAYNGNTIEHKLVEGDIKLYEQTITGVLTYEKRLDKLIEDKGIEKAIEEFPLPIGRYGFSCPCDLPYEEDETIKCKYYKVLKEDTDGTTE